MMFAVLFGLSMDYQVFLLSQIEHHRAAHGSDRDAVAGGLAAGARVITAAALIMMSVFGSFVLNDDPTVKQFGVGLSIGVALAAMTVLLLAPALLVLAGAGSRWMPAWLDRILPRVDVEGERGAPPSARGGDAVEAPAAPVQRCGRPGARLEARFRPSRPAGRRIHSAGRRESDLATVWRASCTGWA